MSRVVVLVVAAVLLTMPAAAAQNEPGCIRSGKCYFVDLRVISAGFGYGMGTIADLGSTPDRTMRGLNLRLDVHILSLVFRKLPIATYDAATTTCANMYCHGNGRGGNGTLSWLETTTRVCGDCHSMTGANMSGRHQRHINRGVLCADCHSTVVDAGQTIIGAPLHINGVHETKLVSGTWNPNTRQCSNTGCHNTRSWN